MAVGCPRGAGEACGGTAAGGGVGLGAGWMRVGCGGWSTHWSTARRSMGLSSDHRWTLTQVSELIARMFHNRYTLRDTANILYRLGCRCRSPCIGTGSGSHLKRRSVTLP